jgi:3-hydroxyisobutyrate dehydrogenase-like beta-hydroxyacid dehydrogenase
MSNGLSIGFVGFGEAGFHIAKGLGQPCIAFDINANTQIRRRAKEAATRLVQTNAELAQSCEIVLSAVTAHQAAHQNAPYLTALHAYEVLDAVAQVSDLR